MLEGLRWRLTTAANLVRIGRFRAAVRLLVAPLVFALAPALAPVRRLARAVACRRGRHRWRAVGASVAVLRRGYRPDGTRRQRVECVDCRAAGVGVFAGDSARNTQRSGNRGRAS